MRLLRLVPVLCATLAAQEPAPIDPPPVDEAALASRLVEMTQPVAGERAVIV